MTRPPARSAWLVYLPSVSHSLTWSVPSELVGGLVNLGTWWIATAMKSDSKHIIFLSAGTAPLWLSPRDAQRPDVHVQYSSSTTLLGAVEEAMDTFQLETALLASFASFIFPPRELLCLTDHVARSDPAASWIGAAPLGAETIALNRSFAKLCRHPSLSPGGNAPASLCRYLKTLEREHTPPFRVHLMEVPTASVRHTEDMPSSIDLNRPEHRQAFTAMCNSYDPLDGGKNLRTFRMHLLAEFARMRIAIRAISGHNTARATVEHPRVLLLSNQAAFSGAEESICQCWMRLDPVLFERTAIIGCPGFFSERLRSSGVKVFDIPSNLGADLLSSRLFFNGLLDQLNPDLVHLNAPTCNHLVWEIARRGIPMVQHIRNGDVGEYREGIEFAHAIIAVSEYLAKKVRRFAVDTSIISVIYDEIDFNVFTPASSNEQQRSRVLLHLRPHCPVILMIARLVPNKRHDIILDSFEELVVRWPNAQLLLKLDSPVKPTAYTTLIYDRIAHAPHANNITVVPFVDDIRALYSAADVLVLCSDDEGLGRCVVEAMAMEIPVVVTNTGGSHELVSDGVSGIVIEGNDPRALTKALATVLTDSDSAHVRARRARDFVKQSCSSQMSATKLEEMYSALLTSR